MLRVERIKASYDEVPALHDVSFKVEPGQIVSIVGANGRKIYHHEIRLQRSQAGCRSHLL